MHLYCMKGIVWVWLLLLLFTSLKNGSNLSFHLSDNNVLGVVDICWLLTICLLCTERWNTGWRKKKVKISRRMYTSWQTYFFLKGMSDKYYEFFFTFHLSLKYLYVKWYDVKWKIIWSVYNIFTTCVFLFILRVLLISNSINLF